MNAKEAKAAVEKYGSRKAAARATGVSWRQMNKALGLPCNGVIHTEVGESSVPKTKGGRIAATAFLHKLDFSAIIAEGIQKHCKREFILERTLRELLEMDSGKFRRGVDNGDFDDNQFKYDGQVYWSTVDNVKAAKSKQGKALS